MSISPQTAKCKVLLVEDHPMFRERMALLINKDLGMVVCGEADNIADAMSIIIEKEPDIAIVDITLRGSSGLELLKDIRAQGLALSVLVLSMHAEELYAERALRAGAKGYIMKSEASSEVIEAIRTVQRGEVYVSRPMVGKILMRMSSSAHKTEAIGVDALADRELEVFQLIGQGRNTREIAKLLNLGESTIETYRARIREKLGLRNTAELAQRAAQWVTEQEI
ncbi:LuxR family transcriptional regulator [Verrucomicrobiaceae bacterium SCGC AG-212-N21]|nr:LuxR family transcriptional regulator [Verrucomicrobiaceae bacterium SCGC AG-212-N21]